MQGLPDLVTVIDEDGRLVYVSDSSSRLLGWPAEQLRGRRACEYIAADDRRNSRAWLAHAQAHVEPPPIIHRLTLADGTHREFETRLRPMDPLEAGGDVVAVSREVSARTRAEDPLDGATDIWRDASDIVSEGVAVVSASGLILAVNRAATRLLCASREELVGSFLGVRVVLPTGNGVHAEDVLGLSEHPSELRLCNTTTRLRVKLMPLPHHVGPTAYFGLVLHEAPAASAPVVQLRSSADPASTLRGAALSPRELDVLRLLTDGYDVRAISSELQISIHTTRYYVKSILRKLDVRTQVQAVAIALRGGLSGSS
jgi:PAS domain S-box-containing protein